MLYNKIINCPICGTELSKLGGGFAGHWGIDKCETCENWIDFDSEMLASDEAVADYLAPATGLHIHADVSPRDRVVGEVATDEMAKVMLAIPNGNFTVFSHHASSASDLVAGLCKAFQPQLDRERHIDELVAYYADRIGLYKNSTISADFVARAMICDLGLPEFDELASVLAHRLVVSAAEMHRKDKLIELYQKQDEARKEYILSKED